MKHSTVCLLHFSSCSVTVKLCLVRTQLLHSFFFFYHLLYLDTGCVSEICCQELLDDSNARAPGCCDGWLWQGCADPHGTYSGGIRQQRRAAEHYPLLPAMEITLLRPILVAVTPLRMLIGVRVAFYCRFFFSQEKHYYGHISIQIRIIVSKLNLNCS